MCSRDQCKLKHGFNIYGAYRLLVVHNLIAFIMFSLVFMLKSLPRVINIEALTGSIKFILLAWDLLPFTFQFISQLNLVFPSIYLRACQSTLKGESTGLLPSNDSATSLPSRYLFSGKSGVNHWLEILWSDLSVDA